MNLICVLKKNNNNFSSGTQVLLEKSDVLQENWIKRCKRAFSEIQGEFGFQNYFNIFKIYCAHLWFLTEKMFFVLIVFGLVSFKIENKLVDVLRK